MSSRCSFLGLSLIVFVSASLPSYAQFSFARLNVPGATATQARGINNSNEIAGFFYTSSCTDSSVVSTCPTEGFKYVNGSFVKLMVPGAVSTAIMGVNDLGDLVGFYKKTDGSSHGFIWFHQNVVKTIDYPNPPFNEITIPMGINKAGTVVGGLWSTFAGEFDGGWVWVNGKFSNMDPESPNAASPCCWSVNGISNNGILAGQVFQGDFNQAWLKQGTDQDFYMYNPSGLNGSDTFGTGVNSATDIVGYGVNGWFAKHIELNEGTNDGAEVSPTFIKVAFPNATTTTPFGLNDARAVVGTYTNSTGTHGFLAKPNF